MKNINKILAILILVIGFTQISFSQNVGIGTPSPDNSAKLDITSTDSGILIPRMDSTQRNAISSPANGLLVYDTDYSTFYYWNDVFSKWIAIINANNSVKKINDLYDGKSDNDGTQNGSSVFLGLNAGNNNDLSDNRNTSVGYEALRDNTTGHNNTSMGYQSLVENTSGSDNTAIGYMALTNIPDGIKNTAIGSNALKNNFSGKENVALGYSSLFKNTSSMGNVAVGNEVLYENTEGSFNSGLGYKSLNKNTIGKENTALGDYTLSQNTSGSNNTAIGNEALLLNTTGFSNVAIGTQSLHKNTSVSNLVAIGDSALYNNGIGATGSTDAIGNTAVGSKALLSNTTGSDNTATGYQALYAATGDDNTAIGWKALFNLTSGSQNTAIGYQVYPFGTNTYSNYTGIGYNTGTNIANPSNRVEVGNMSVGWIGGQVDWSTYSDKRIKENIKSDVLGLEFITLLNPVTYNLNIHKQNKMMGIDEAKGNKDWEGKYDIEERRMTGFLAQEVAEAARKTNYDFSGVDISENENELYSLRYAEFVVPLVKAVQEQQEIIKQQETKLQQQEKRLQALEKMLLKNK